MNRALQDYTLITGASSGLGKEFSVQCAARGMNILMMALPGSFATGLAESLMQEYDVDVKVFEFDLTDRMQLLEHLNHILENFEVSCLINNAGIGGTAAMSESSMEALDQILQVNIRSMVQITQTLLPHLLRQQKSYILNVSSMAAFTPIAYKTVYPASKAFISSFSLGLKEELYGTAVSVSVVCPGQMMTNSSVSARIIKQGIRGRIGLMSTAEVVRISLQKTFAGKAVIIPGAWNKINYLLMRFLPLELKLKIASRVIRKDMVFK